MNIIYSGFQGVFTTSKAEANEVYNRAIAARKPVEELITMRGSSIPGWLKDKAYGIDKWFWPNYEAFSKASELSYGNWLKAAQSGEDQYKAVLAEIRNALAKSPDAPSMDPMLIAGIVIAAAAVGFLLLPKSGGLSGLSRRRRRSRR